MKLIVRYLLVWLMLLALPFQGIASAAMLTCAHGSMRQAAPDAMAAPQHDATMNEGHCHEQAVSVSAPADHHGDAHDHDGRCSTCADCCIGAALAPAPGLGVAAPDTPAVFHHGAAGHLAAVDLALPERPPRFPLA